MTHASYASVRSASSNELLGSDIAVAKSWFARLVGLLNTKSLEEHAGLWLSPCKGIHTVGMRYPIDVVFLDREQAVCKLAGDVRAFRFRRANRKTRSALELPAGAIKRCGLRVGDKLLFEEAPR